jgi:hypothetical protein
MTARKWLAAGTVVALGVMLCHGVPLRADDVPAEEREIVIHVSSSAGVDGQDGRSPETAVKTIRRGQALLRDGHGDRLLLKRGDVFEETFGAWNKSGNNPDDPLVIGAYGDGPRPKVVAQQAVFNIYGNGPLLHDLTISGIHFAAAGRNPNAPDYDPAAPGGNGIRIVRPAHRITIEDCRFECFNGNLILTGDERKGRLQDIVVRRCLVLDSYATNGAHSGQGLYADKVDGLTIEGCVFDHNGWNEKVPGAVANIFRHNIYISHDTTGVRVRGNVIANGASHGMQMRAGGVCEGNLFIDNAIHAFMGGEDAVFRGNVIVGGRDIDAKTPRGHGVTVAAGRSLVADNLIVHKPTSNGAAISIEVGKWSPPSGVNAEIRDNVVYNWNGNGLEIAGEAKSVSFHDNDLQQILGSGRRVVAAKKAVEQLTLANNRYHAADGRPEKWFNLPEGLVAPAEWGQRTRDTSRLEQARYPSPDRALPADFLAGARDEKVGYTAAAAIASLREAFGKKPLTNDTPDPASERTASSRSSTIKPVAPRVPARGALPRQTGRPPARRPS